MELKILHSKMRTLTGLKVFEAGKIYWVSSYRSVLLYMKKYDYILRPDTNYKTDKGKRYYVSEENIDKLVRFHELGKLN